MSTNSRNSTMLTHDQCGRCGTPILTGLDDPRHALPATLDPILYDRDQTIGLVLLGRYAYHVTKTVGARWQIASSRYTATPTEMHLPGSRWDHKTNYLTQHMCGQVIPGGHPIRLPTPQGGADLFTAASEAPSRWDGPPPY